MVVLFDRERRRPIVLDSVPQTVQRADSGITAPGEDELRSAARADQLVIYKVRGHPDQGQVAAPLADNLMAGSKRDQVGEAFQRNDIAIAHHFLDRFL